MAGSSKKQKVKSKKATKNRPLWRLHKNGLKNLVELAVKSKNSALNGIKDWARNVKDKIWAIPAWIKSRPAAYKAWKKEDKKKKKYRSFRLQKRIKPEPRYIPTSKRLFKETFVFIWQHKKILFGIFLIHCILYFLLVRAPISTNISTIQESVSSIFGEDNKNSINATVATLSTVVGVSGAAQANATGLSILVLGMSFVYIWAARQLHAGQDIKVREAYYQSFTSLVPVILLLIVLSLQLVPFVLSSFIYATARTGGLFANGFEDLSIFVITLLIALLCFYWITSTILALYIVTLPGMYPIHALRSAKKLVQFRRFIVFKRIVVLPIILGITYTLLLLLVIRVWPEQTFITAEISQLLFLPIVHTYLYKLYRSLI